MIHMTVDKHLKDAPDLAPISKKGQFAMHGYTDTSLAANPDNRRSTAGYLLLLCGRLSTPEQKRRLRLHNQQVRRD